MRSVKILHIMRLIMFLAFFILVPFTSFGSEFISAINNPEITNLRYFICVWIMITEATLGFVLVKLEELMEGANK